MLKSSSTYHGCPADRGSPAEQKLTLYPLGCVLPSLPDLKHAYHGRAHVFMSEKFLDGPDIVTVFEQVGRTQVPDCLGFRGLGVTCSTDGFLQGPLMSHGPSGSNRLTCCFQNTNARGRMPDGRPQSKKPLKIKSFGGDTALPPPQVNQSYFRRRGLSRAFQTPGARKIAVHGAPGRRVPSHRVPTSGQEI